MFYKHYLVLINFLGLVKFFRLDHNTDYVICLCSVITQTFEILNILLVYLHAAYVCMCLINERYVFFFS